MKEIKELEDNHPWTFGATLSRIISKFACFSFYTNTLFRKKSFLSEE